MKKMSFGERVRITKRGFGILRKYCPGLAEQKALYEFIVAGRIQEKLLAFEEKFRTDGEEERAKEYV